MWYKSLIKLCFMLAGPYLLTACSKSEILEQETQRTIRFTEVSTRAAISTADEMKEFRVWGLFSKDNNTHPVFESEDGTGERVYKKDGGTWTYDNTRYWLEGFTYRFHALHGAESATINEGMNTISCSAFDCSKGNDLMSAVSDEYSVAANNIPKSVPFTFKHRLAKVVVKLKAATGVSATVKSAKFYGMSCTGDFSYALADQTITWSKEGSGASSTDTPFEYSGQEVVVSGTTELSLFGDMLLLPQQINGATLAVTLNRGQGEETLTVTLPQTTWEENNAYVYTSTVEQTGISFTDFTVQEWNYSYSGGSVNIQ